MNVIQTFDGGFLVGGKSGSGMDGTKTSPNLASWVSFHTNDLTSNAVQILDRNATNAARRWYRARVH